MDWCRLWHDMPTDPKWRTISRLSQQPVASVIAVYVHLLVQASANATERGRTQPNAEDLASTLDLQTEQVEAILSSMQGRVMDGLLLSGWQKRQPKREDGSSERSRIWRENNKIDRVDGIGERKRTQANANDQQTRRDGDETRQEVLLVKEVLDSTDGRTDGQQNSLGKNQVNGHRNGSVRPSSVLTPLSPEVQMRSALEDYMRMSGTPLQRQYKSPDPRIVQQCLQAIGATQLWEVFDFLSERFRNGEQAPNQQNGPRKYAWFVTVLRERFGGTN